MKIRVIFTGLVLMAALYLPVKAETSCVAHWNFDESPGAAILNDIVGTADGLVGQGVTFVTSTAGATGEGYGNAGDFSATVNYIELGMPDVLDLGTGDFTMSGWFKSPAVPVESAYQFIFFNGVHNGGGVNLMLYRGDRSSAGKFTFDVKGASSNITVLSNARLDDNVWHWFAAMVKSGTAYLYIDGVLQASTLNASGTTATAPSTTDAKLGSNYDGLIDDFRIYDTALTATVDSSSILVAGELYYLWLGDSYRCREIWQTGYGSKSDFNQDCIVDMKDLAEFAQDWMLQVSTETIPFYWEKPTSFSDKISGLGLDTLEGVTHQCIFDPLVSAACVDEGGTGIYEGTTYGTYNHHPKLAIWEDKFITYWTNHAKDENGPGQRLLARIGTFDTQMDNIDWGTNETLVEIAPAPVPVRRRTVNYDTQTIYGVYTSGRLMLINDRLYSEVTLVANYGWTDNISYRWYDNPIPATNFSLTRMGAFTLDVWWNLGVKYYQRWRIEQNTIVPDSEMYKTGTHKNPIEVTPGVFKNLAPVASIYLNAVDLSGASSDFYNDINNGVPVVFTRSPIYASGTLPIAADGINGLAHQTEFQRPDGKWVVVRDNLFNRGCYYAAIKSHYNNFYPPAQRTNLYGDVQPSARELDDGRVYIICNSIGRKDMFVTVSDDGKIFDRTWLLLHSDRVQIDDGLYKGGGPQYFQSYVVGSNIWVVYSITKEQIGATKIPVILLN